MALGFNSTFINNTKDVSGILAPSTQQNTASYTANNSVIETAGSIASTNVDSFESNNPFAPQIDYSQYTSAPETAGSIASGIETAGSLACETAGSIASFSGGGESFSSSSNFVC